MLLIVNIRRNCSSSSINVRSDRVVNEDEERGVCVINILAFCATGRRFDPCFT